MRKITCNMCGKEFDVWDAQEDFNISGWIGYGSKFDGLYLQLDLCCDCMDNLIRSCKITPVSEH